METGNEQDKSSLLYRAEFSRTGIYSQSTALREGPLSEGEAVMKAVKTCRKCGHATESLVSKTPCPDGGYHSWNLPDNPEAGTPCWNCPLPTCDNPPPVLVQIEAPKRKPRKAQRVIKFGGRQKKTTIADREYRRIKYEERKRAEHQVS